MADIELIKKAVKKASIPNYKARVDALKRMSIHTEGATNSALDEILFSLRPNETTAEHDYRKKNWSPITQSAYGKVLNVLHRIYDPRVYSIEYPQPPAGTSKVSEYLNKSITRGDLFYSSFWDFMENEYLHTSLTDPYAVVVVIPRKPLDEMEAGEQIEPVPHVFRCDQIRHDEDGIMILFADSPPEGESNHSRPVWYVSNTEITYAWPERSGGDIVWKEKVYMEVPDGFQVNPAIYVGHRVQKKIKISFIHEAVPYWTDALNEYSDSRMVKTSHAFPKMWEYDDFCQTCMGSGTDMNDLSAPCPSCNGNKRKRIGGPNTVYVAPQRIQGTPNPPWMGYVQPDPEILKVLPESVTNCLDEAYSALNMDMLRRQEGSNESGTSKNISRQELQTYLLKVSNSVHWVESVILKIITYQRYSGALANWDEIVPIVHPPLAFDVSTADIIVNEMKTAKEAGASPAYISELEAIAAEKQFGEGTDRAIRARMCIDLDPLAGYSADDISAHMASIRDIDAYMHTNIRRILDDIHDDDANFSEKPKKKQKEVLRARATEEMKAMTVIPTPGLPEPPLAE